MILKYPVRVALNPFASTIGYLLPYVVSGSIIVSLVLSLPTVGPLLLRALIAQDMFLAGTIVLLLGVLTVVGTLVSDLLLMWIDPRIRIGGRSDSHVPVRSPAAAPAKRGWRGDGRGARLGRDPVAAHVVALPPAPPGHASAPPWSCSFYLVVRASPTSSPTRARRRPRRSARCCRRRRSTGSTRAGSRPHVYGLRGRATRRPSSASTRPTRTRRSRCASSSPGFEYKLFGLFPPTATCSASRGRSRGDALPARHRRAGARHVVAPDVRARGRR